MKWKARTRAAGDGFRNSGRAALSVFGGPLQYTAPPRFCQLLAAIVTFSLFLPSPVKQPDCRSLWKRERERERMEGGLDFLPPSLSPSRDMRPSAAKNGVYKFATVVGPFLPFRRLPRPSD